MAVLLVWRAVIVVLNDDSFPAGVLSAEDQHHLVWSHNLPHFLQPKANGFNQWQFHELYGISSSEFRQHGQTQTRTTAKQA
uniref:Putative secreted protein n=1 Tax=Rhipicephalus microplus TaxID=6941 RepID=A0A6G5A182_RHIMP